MAVHRDPLDVGDPHRKAWEEFQASYASSFLQIWLLDELDEVAPAYFDNLNSRLSEGFLNADALAEDDPEYDGAVPLQSPGEKGVWFIPREEADDLFERLFPHGVHASSDKTTAYGLALVGLHSALESYCTAASILLDRKLPFAVLAHLRRLAPKRDLGAEVADALAEFHETRRIIVHNRGAVDERYVNAVKDNRLLPGERKKLDFVIASRFARAVWQTAQAVRDSWLPHDT